MSSVCLHCFVLHDRKCIWPVGNPLQLYNRSPCGVTRQKKAVEKQRELSVSRCCVVSVQISAHPSDINVLPEYSRDPRVVTNLVDGVNRTQDDTHMWLTPFTAGRPHYVYLAFDQHVNISVLRIWVCAVYCLQRTF